MISANTRPDNGVVSDQRRCLAAALEYAERGFSVIALYGIVDGQCTCGKPDCDRPGKHPIGPWKKAQTERATPEELEEAFRQHPPANVGIVTGDVSKLVVSDVDGEEGADSLNKILPAGLPKVPTVATGKGYHLYGRHPGHPLKNFVKTHPGLDGRADGGYVVAPPSRHISGREYRWERPLRDPMPELPRELLDLFTSRNPVEQQQKQHAHAKGETSAVAPFSGRYVSNGLKKYAETALIEECANVSLAPIGQQEITLSTAGLKIGGYVGAGLLEFAAAKDALVEAALQMANDPARSRWTRSEIVTKIEIKLRDGMKNPKWGADPRGEGDDQTPPLDIFGDVAVTGRPVFPVEALPQVLADFAIDRAERLGVDPAMIAMPALVTCAAVLDDQNTVQVRRHDQQFVQSARLWLAVIDEPGGKKTPAINTAIEPLHDLKVRWSKEDASKFEDYKLQMHVYKQQMKELGVNLLFSGLTEPQKPPRRCLIFNDTTTEALARTLADNPSGMIGVYDELAQLWGSFDAYHASKGPGRDRPLWLQLYDGGRRSIDRVSGHLDVPNWGASIVGGIQPERMRQISSNLAEDGMLQRFMLVFGSGPSMGIDRGANEEADRAYRGVLETIADWRGLAPAKVTLSPEAHDARERVMQRLQLLLRLPEIPAALKNHLNKWEALFARLALTLHAITIATLDRAFSTFGRSHGLEYACEIPGEIGRSVEKLMLDYLLPTALRFYSEFYGRPEHVKHACWVADHILARRLPSISGRDVGRAYNALRDDPQALERAMSYLETAGWIVPMNGTNARRPSQWWVDPRVHQIFTERAEAELLRRDKEIEEIRQAKAQLRKAA